MVNFRNGYLQVGQPLGSLPVVNLNANNKTINVMTSPPATCVFLQSNAGASSRVFTLVDSTILGHTVTLLLNSANGCTLQDSGNADLVGGNWVAEAQGTSISLVWNGTAWAELGRNNVTGSSSSPVTIDATLTTLNQEITITSGASAVFITSDSDQPELRQFTLSDGTAAGQLVTLIVVSDGGTGCLLGSSGNVSLANADWVASNQFHTLTVEWTGTIWAEVARAVGTAGVPIATSSGNFIYSDLANNWVQGPMGGMGSLNYLGQFSLNTGELTGAYFVNNSIASGQLDKFLPGSQFDGIVLSDADVLALHTTPITFLPPPTAEDSACTVVMSATFTFHPSAPYADGANIKIGYSDTDDVILEFPASLLTSSVSITNFGTATYDPATFNLIANKTSTLKIWTDGPAFTGGASGNIVAIYVKYNWESLPGVG